MKPRDIASYIFLAVTWGLSFLVLLKVVHAFGWVGAVTLRSLVAGITLPLLAAATRRRLDFSAGWRHFAVVGATTVAAQLIGLSYATPRIGTAMAAILVAAIPLFSMIISQLWGLERITIRGLAGLLLGAAGIIVLVGFPAVPVTASFALGCAASLLSSFSAAFGSNYANRHLRSVGSLEVTSAAFLFGGLMTLPLLLAVPVPTTPRAIDFLYLIVLACVMSALTYVVYFRLVASIGATRTISVEFAVTTIAVLVGTVMLGESLTIIQSFGAVAIIGGCILVLDPFPRPVKAAASPSPAN
ncbi:MAG: DMT family transporter [Mesorhizobium sp.]|nr:DMT family transporter [bacterium M00.F.Ca.ET.205.01.1.1]TGU55345.1 DMT family transporter [bacterium M00.F.Ca.ET.152.01.1.1]TGV40366.1 DMT family transporter [Mesorhizobium sp. M00.F.Ca.ET.186.01.1.1]TGZ45362.1 DMT family transporter [bacterium M00.F.Ca.ET.162.01.1.1]TIW61480.1 MAG: DMT family transporter [Mesorhizobium sp.]